MLTILMIMYKIVRKTVQGQIFATENELLIARELALILHRFGDEQLAEITINWT
jgi:hypothetical protein